MKEEYYFREGCFITELFNTPNDPLVSVAQARVVPGATTEWHHLEGITERYLIVSGKGIVEIGDLLPREAGPGDEIVIPPGTRQRITNDGDESLIFLAVCTPRFQEQVYRE
jgi:mannose-6-phosphate isomerase-like protein (cupin superfamily)